MSENRPSKPVILRADLRHPVTWKASIRCQDWQIAEKVAVTNLSKGGMFVHTDHPPPVGTPVEVELVLPDGRKEQLTGTVRHQVSPGASSASAGVGVEIDPSCRNPMLALAEIARIEQQSALRSASSPEPPKPPLRPSWPRGRPVDGIGIDFGMSYSRVAVCAGTSAMMVPDAEGRVLMPSLVTFPEGGGTAVGWDAHGLQASLPHRTLSSLKRLLGRKYSDPLLGGLLHSLPLPNQAGPNGNVVIDVDGSPIALPQICTLILRELKAAGEQQVGCEIQRAVFSHPVAFTQSYKTALQRAAQLAGLEVAGFVEEPVAGALGYGMGRGKNEIIAVYDFGGGTFDFTLVDMSYAQYRVLASGGDEWLGGDDFDHIMAEAAANAHWRSTKIELRDRAVEWAQLLRAAEAAKRELSRSAYARLTLATVSPELDLTVDRKALAHLCRELLERSLEVCRQTFDQAGLEPEQVNHVVLSGGTTQIPFIQEGLSTFFGRPVANTSGLDPQEAVALGTSLLAARLAKP